MLYSKVTSYHLPLDFRQLCMLEHMDWDRWSEDTWTLFSKFLLNEIEFSCPGLPSQDAGGHSCSCMLAYSPHSLVGWPLHFLYLWHVRRQHALPDLGYRLRWTPYWCSQASSEDLEPFCPLLCVQGLSMSQVSFCWPGNSFFRQRPSFSCVPA